MDAAFTAAINAENPGVRVQGLTSLARDLDHAGYIKRAENFFTLALKTANEIDHDYYRTAELCRVAHSLASTGFAEKVKKVFAWAVDEAEVIKDKRTQVKALRYIAFLLVQSGFEEWAKEIFARAYDVANDIADNDVAAETIADLVIDEEKFKDLPRLNMITPNNRQ